MDGIIDNYFDDMTINNLPQSHQSESNQGLSVTGISDSPHLRPHLLVNTDQREIINVPVTAEIEGSEGNPFTIDSAPEAVTKPITHQRQSGPRRNVGPPKFFGDRRFIDVVRLTVSPERPRATFMISSPSDFVTPLAEVPPLRTLATETTLTWLSKSSCPSVRPIYSPIMSILKDTSSGSHSVQSTIKNSLDKVDKLSEITSTIDPEVKAKLVDFDEQFN